MNKPKLSDKRALVRTDRHIEPGLAPPHILYTVDGELVPVAPIDPDQPPQGFAKASDTKAKLPNGLFPRADIFARYVARGAALSDAYRAAFGDRTTPAQTTNRCARLMRAPRMQEAIRNYKVALSKEGAQTPVTMRNFVTGRLVHEGQTAKNDGTRVRALELLGKTQGMFTDVKRIETITSGDIDKLKAQLSQRLSEIAQRFIQGASPGQGDENRRLPAGPHPTGAPLFSPEGPVAESHIISPRSPLISLPSETMDGTHIKSTGGTQISPTGVFVPSGREMQEGDL